MTPITAELYLSDARGVYIPQNFAEQTRRECVTGVSDADWQTLLSGPGNEWYWEAWQAVCDSATVTNPGTGQQYRVYQDGDCWLIPVEWEWDDAAGWFRDPTV